MTPKDRKASLRAQWKKKLLALDVDWALLGQSLGEHMAPHCVGQLGLFAPLPGEPSLLSLWDPKRVFFPRVRGQAMEFYRVDSLDALEPGYQGILEPPAEATHRVKWTADDWIAVPGTVFDVFGGRLGKGGGFYDRYLPGCAARRVGVAAECQIVEDSLARETFDVRMDALCSELKWRFVRGK